MSINRPFGRVRRLVRPVKRAFNPLAWRHSAKVADVTLRMVWDRLGGKRVVILDLEEETLLPFILPVVEQLRWRTDRIAYYATYKTRCPPLGDLIIPRERTFYYRLSRNMVAADMFISPHIYGNAAPRTTMVHVPHGHPVKFTCLPKASFERFNVHFLIGPLHREQTEFTIAHYGLQRDIRLCDVGLPKSDELMSGRFDDRVALLEGLGLDPARKTLIYAPSWEEGLSLRAFGTMLFDQLACLSDLNVIIRLHPGSCVPRDHPEFALYTGGFDWTELVAGYLRYPNIQQVSRGSTDALLAASDVMVTDISGVALDFLALLKPVIYVDCPEFFEKTLPTLYRDFGANTPDIIRSSPTANAGRHVGYVVERIDELPSAVRFMLENPDFKLAERKAYAMRLRYNPGRSAEVAASTIMQMLHLKRLAEAS